MYVPHHKKPQLTIINNYNTNVAITCVNTNNVADLIKLRMYVAGSGKHFNPRACVSVLNCPATSKTFFVLGFRFGVCCCWFSIYRGFACYWCAYLFMMVR